VAFLEAKIMTETDIKESDALDWPVLGKLRMDRDEILTLASELITLLHHRTCGERFREQDGDKMRTTYARVLVSAIQAYSGLLKDAELDELKRRIEAIEQVKEKSP
jgi:hypothetical protein